MTQTTMISSPNRNNTQVHCGSSSSSSFLQKRKEQLFQQQQQRRKELEYDDDDDMSTTTASTTATSSSSSFFEYTNCEQSSSITPTRRINLLPKIGGNGSSGKSLFTSSFKAKLQQWSSSSSNNKRKTNNKKKTSTAPTTVISNGRRISSILMAIDILDDVNEVEEEAINTTPTSPSCQKKKKKVVRFNEYTYEKHVTHVVDIMLQFDDEKKKKKKKGTTTITTPLESELWYQEYEFNEIRQEIYDLVDSSIIEEKDEEYDTTLRGVESFIDVVATKRQLVRQDVWDIVLEEQYWQYSDQGYIFNTVLLSEICLEVTSPSLQKAQQQGQHDFITVYGHSL